MNGKKWSAIVLSAVMLVSAMAIVPVNADAAETYEDKIIYEDQTAEFHEKWAAENAVAPTKTGYVFGGWFEKTEDTYVALTKADAEAKQDENVASGVYAKFVPAYVLSVKAQIDAVAQKGTSRGDEEEGSIRIVSSVDSKDYQKVGFDILLANKTQLLTKENKPLETSTIYTALKVNGTDYAADKVFGAQSKFLSVWRLDGILKANDSKIINVTPYWITKDGTKVSGLTKYVHVEDGYLGYISVPVSLRTAEQVAAGTLSVTYPAGLEFIGAEYDGVFKTEMTCYDDAANHKVNFAGNADTVNTNVDANGIYANLRFKAGTSGYVSGQGTFLDFQVTDEKFCDWSEKRIAIDAWDIQY